jgi:hypothetical protein
MGAGFIRRGGGAARLVSLVDVLLLCEHFDVLNAGAHILCIAVYDL